MFDKNCHPHNYCSRKSDIDEANKKALEIIQKGKPEIIDIQTAGDVIPGMAKKTILHAGPPVTWGNMCGPMKGAVIGGLIFEGLAGNREEAEKLAASGEIWLTAFFKICSRLPQIMIVAPSSWNRLAISKPIPVPPPVINATFFSSTFIISIPFHKLLFVI